MTFTIQCLHVRFKRLDIFFTSVYAIGISVGIYSFPRATLHESQRSCKFDYLYSSFVYSMSTHAVYCIHCVMSLSAGKQRSFGPLSARDKKDAITFQENQC